MIVDRLTQYNLKIKIEKCQIAQERIEYLSHIISHGKITPSPAKINDLLKFKSPLTEKQVHSVIGFGSYYRKFIANFASIVSPLLRAIQKKPFKWNNDCEEACEILKTKLTQYCVLMLPKFNQHFLLETDACNYGVGGVLLQENKNNFHPVAYFSKHLSKQERNFSTTQKEFFAIVLSVEHFKQFLYGITFRVITDHQPLTVLSVLYTVV